MDSERSESQTISEGLGEIIFHRMKQYVDRPLQFLPDTDDIDSFNDVLTRCIRVAMRMKEKGIKEGDIIGICSDNNKNNCVPYIATLFILGIPVNFDPRFSETVLLLKLTSPTIIFVTEKLVSTIECCLKKANIQPELVVFGTSDKYSQFEEYLCPVSKEIFFQPTPVGDIRKTAIILFSSGTTDAPKIVCFSHYSILKKYLVMGSALTNKNGNSSPVYLVYSGLYWIASILFLIYSIFYGGSRVITSNFDSVRHWHLINKYKVNVAFLIPNRANEIVNNPPVKDIDTTSLKNIIIGGSPVSKNVMEKMQNYFPEAAVLNCYGQTEMGGLISSFDSTNPRDMEMQKRKPLSSGKIFPIFQWKVVDLDTGKKLGPYQKGELRLKSECMLSGYYKAEFTFALDEDGFFKTGDICYYDDDMCFFIVDRIKDMFKINIGQVSPAILEEVIMTHPAVKECAIIGIPHVKDRHQIMAVIVLNEEYPPKEIEEYFNGMVSEELRLTAGVKIVKGLIKTMVGKVKRRAITEMVVKGEL